MVYQRHITSFTPEDRWEGMGTPALIIFTMDSGTSDNVE